MATYTLTFKKFFSALCGKEFYDAIEDYKIFQNMAFDGLDRFHRQYRYVTKRTLTDVQMQTVLNTIFYRMLKLHEDGILVEPVIYGAVHAVNEQHRNAISAIRIVDGHIRYEISDRLIQLITRNGWPAKDADVIFPNMARNINPNLCELFGSESAVSYRDIDRALLQNGSMRKNPRRR